MSADDTSRAAYSGRSAEYIDLLGSMKSVHPSDLQVVSTWACGIRGDLIDAGCGPGHWTDFLAQRGSSVRGIDQVPEFIAHAAHAYPTVDFAVGDLRSLDDRDGSVGGVLSWYSLIHHDPQAIRVPLLEFSRVMAPGGALLLGFFEGPAVEQFAHAVAPAYRWSVEALTAELALSGFEVVESIVRRTVGQRSHASISARRVGLES